MYLYSFSGGTFSDKKLTELGAQGIGVHHAGLDQSDRRQIESLFSLNKISVLCEAPSFDPPGFKKKKTYFNPAILIIYQAPPRRFPLASIFQLGVSLFAAPKLTEVEQPVEMDSKITANWI
jgi:replicative superfamily II helicase